MRKIDIQDLIQLLGIVGIIGSVLMLSPVSSKREQPCSFSDMQNS